MKGGGGIASRGGGGTCVPNICKKSHTEATMVMAADKHKEVALLHHVGFAVVDFVTLVGCIGKSCFLK
jgi:hypothetical protein